MKTITFLSMLVNLVFLSFWSYAQLFSVSGTIQDSVSGKMVKQISVVERKSGIGTISGDNGNFLLQLKSNEVKLVFSDDNYQTHAIEFVLKRDTTIDVILQPLETEADRKVKKEATKDERQREFTANHDSRKK